MSKKKICFIAQFPPPMHGLSKAVETLYNSELAQEFDFEKVDITDNKRILSNLVAIRKSKADLFYFTISQTKGGNLRDLAILRAIGNRTCLVHLHGGYYRTLVDKDMPGWQRKANYKAVGKLSGAIVLGPSLKWIFEGMLPDEKIFTVPNCVDDEYLMSDEVFEEKVRILPERKIKHVLYLSNFINSKGYPKVLEMAKLEKERGGERRFHFDFAGKFFEKSEEDFFWNYIKGNELEDYVTFHGVVGGDKKRDLLKRCDVFVLLTTYPNEGQPISILEAMGNGMVVVATDHAGIPDLISQDDGLIYDSKHISIPVILNDVSSLEEKIIIRRARLEVMDKYTQNYYIRAIGTVYKEILTD
ncbi:glycosyltransferase family 4 protein [uncultured Acetatifactor sp.]|uniref:glycosyltransferase family 4 protein n=1 Tax=uncultured Acetatifactor sp. TaxID=1671927 RepID=UPI00262FCB17|nr:glycosyltransferase family 4 protein [uncultured Acetatifactor sp.]